MRKKLVQFGAGKIGRSFIAQLFSQAGYEVVFVDIDSSVVDALNERRSYPVIIKSNNGDDKIIVQHVRAVHGADQDAVVKELLDAGLVSVSVGQAGLPHIIPLIAMAIQKRTTPLDVIIAENMRNADDFIREHIKPLLPSGFPLNEKLGLIETSIGKMVPIMTKKDMEHDPLMVFAEPYNNLILDKKGFINPVPDVKGLSPKENMKAWVDRKLFIHNLGHAATAYFGYVRYPDKRFIYEVLEDADLWEEVRQTMLQSGDILMAMYPDEFDQQHIIDHTDDLLHRFANKALGDTIFRVGCDLPRKLSRHDRLMGVLLQGRAYHLPFDKIMNALVHGFHFRAKDESGNMHPNDQQFKEIYSMSPAKAIEEVCGVMPQEDPVLFNDILQADQQIKS